MDNVTLPMPLPIFPLQVFLLPGGKIRLRVFESKYIKLISLASSKGGFIIKQGADGYNTGRDYTEHVNIGNLVAVRDFHQGQGGVLEVDVYCLSIISINDVITEGDLTFATMVPISHWSGEQRLFTQAKNELAISLNDIINEDIMLSSLYEEKSLENQTWVIARWLELLPMNLTMKKSFICSSDFTEAKAFVESIIYQ
jgi:Lon protease-like protein